MNKIKARYWISVVDNLVTYKNHWYSFKRKLRTDDYVDKRGYIRRGSSSSLYDPGVRKEETHYIVNPSSVKQFLLRRQYGDSRL